MNVTLHGNEVFADGVKLRRGHTGLGWALNPMNGIFTREKKDLETETPEGKDGGRDWSDVATRQGTSGATRSWETGMV